MQPECAVGKEEGSSSSSGGPQDAQRQPEQHPWQELAESIRGELQILDEESLRSFALFNSANRPKWDKPDRPRAVLKPLCAEDVSKGVRFALKYSLSLSVKSGGYNPSNWSSAGQLVVDLSSLRGIHLDDAHTSQSSDAATASGTSSSQSHQQNGDSDGQQRRRNGKRKAGEAVSPPGSPMHGISDSGNGSSTSTSSNGAAHPSILSPIATMVNGTSRQSASSPSAQLKSPDLRSNSGRSSSSASGSASASASATRSRSTSMAAGGSGTTAASSSADARNTDTVMSSRGETDGLAPQTNGIQVPQEVVPSASSERASGKRRLLESDDISSAYTGAGAADMNRAADVEPPRSPANQNAATEARSDGTRTSGEFSRFILANSYPPLNLANADLSDGTDLAEQAEEASHHSAVAPGSAYPFNYDAIGQRAIFPNAAPPGALPLPPYANTNGGMAPVHSESADGMAFSTRSADHIDRFVHGQGTTSSAAGNPYRENQNRHENPSSLPFGVTDPTDHILVTFGSGVRAKELDEATAKRGYFVPQACYPVGTAIFTTGGYGFVSRLFGLSMDITTQMEVVLPSDGRIVTLHADYESNPSLSDEAKQEQEELWWACRGAGTAFGIITEIRAKAFKVGQVLAGNVIFPYNPITAPSLVKHWRDCIKSAPRELYTNITLTAGPSAKGHVIIIQFSWCGRLQAEGEAILQAILSWDGERCLLKDVEARPYADQQENVSQILSSRSDTRWLVRSTLLSGLTDEAIHSTIQKFESVPPGSSWLFEIAGGAIAEPGHETCFPLEHRTSPIQTAALHQWTDDTRDAVNKAAAEDWVYRTFGDAEVGPFPCFLASGEGRERMIKVYGQKNWERLRVLKRKYDPQSLLRFNHFENELSK